MFCRHKYEIVGKKEYTDTSWGLKQPRTIYHLRCTKCGKMKYENLAGWVIEND